MANVIEKGDVYLFYRNKVNVEQPKGRKDVQRLHMIMVPDEGKKARMFVVGRKRLPEIIKGKSKSTERQWMMNYSTEKPEKIGEELAPIEYETKTRGERREGEAMPAAEGRYVIFERDGSTQFAYKLMNPDKPGPAQKELGIEAEASYVISVRNPEVKVSGFPEEKPNYPQALKKKFADKRWIDVSDPRLMNYENAQLVLIGAHDNLADLDIKVTGKPKLFKNLGLDKKKISTETLYEGKFAQPQKAMQATEPSGDRTKGGRRGGRAATKSASAAGIAKALKGVDFPKKRTDLVKYAKNHGAKGEVLKVLEELPRRQFKTMADVQKALSEVR